MFDFPYIKKLTHTYVIYIGQIAKLKPAIGEMIKKYNVKCTPDKPNPGCLYVEFGQGTGDLSWLDRITDRVEKGNCAIM